jgi:hypothetical protein
MDHRDDQLRYFFFPPHLLLGAINDIYFVKGGGVERGFQSMSLPENLTNVTPRVIRSLRTTTASPRDIITEVSEKETSSTEGTTSSPVR